MNAPAVVARPFRRAAALPLMAPLGVRDFRLVWFGEGVSLMGDQFHFIALSWLVLGLTGSGLALGTILLAASIPRAIFLLLGGVLSDRVSPRNLALASNILRAVITTIIAGLVVGSQVQIWHLVVAGVAFGTVDAVFWPAINTLVPRLVPADRLAAANALMQGTAQLVGTVGPAVAGIAIAVVGVAAAFAVDAVSFAVAAVALWSVRGGATAGRPETASEPAPTPAVDHAAIDPSPDAVTEAVSFGAPATEAPRPSVIASLREGITVVLGDPLMRSIVVVSTTANLAFNGPINVGLPWLVITRFGGDPAGLGLLLAAFGAGSLAGVLVAGSAPRPARLGTVVTVIVFVMAAVLAALGLVPTIPAAALVLVWFGVMNGYVNIVVISWVQAKTDPEMLGRTMSFLMLGSVVAAPLSIALAAILIDGHATAMFLGASLLVVGSGLVAIASGLPRRMV